MNIITMIENIKQREIKRDGINEVRFLIMYMQGFTGDQISRALNVTAHYIATIKIKYNFKRKNKYNHKRVKWAYGSKKDLEVMDAIRYFKPKDMAWCYEKRCGQCKEYKVVDCSYLRFLEKEGKLKDWKCQQCDKSFENMSKKMSGKKLSKANTTGYIGVSVLKYRGEVKGYVMMLKHEEKYLIHNKYMDEYLSDYTLTQAVCDRELFIIKHDLPHTRNLTDDELESKLEILKNRSLVDVKGMGIDLVTEKI